MVNSIISKKAKIHKSVKIGKFSVIEDDVEIGAFTEIGSFVLIKNGTKIGKNNSAGLYARWINRKTGLPHKNQM